MNPGAPDAPRARTAGDGSRDFSHEIIGAAVEVQRELGTGLLDSAYASALAVELRARGLQFSRDVPIAASYKGQDVGVAFRADFVVEDAVILELKSSSLPVEARRGQLQSHVRLAGMNLGLVIDFNEMPLTKAVLRVVNKL
jgi:GxxExxY protein